jgi:drug/metabolite transporter (DMT)-like permease
MGDIGPKTEYPAMEEREKSIRTLYVALASGAALWIVTMAATGRSEAWDSPWYWDVTYPLCIALAALLGYLTPVRPWRWGFAVIMIQLPVVMFTSGNSWNLLPLGIAAFLLMSLPAVAAAVAAARLRRWKDA